MSQTNHMDLNNYKIAHKYVAVQTIKYIEYMYYNVTILFVDMLVYGSQEIVA